MSQPSLTRWAVIEVHVYEVEGPTREAAASAAREAQPDLEPICRTATAELLEAGDVVGRARRL